MDYIKCPICGTEMKRDRKESTFAVDEDEDLQELEMELYYYCPTCQTTRVISGIYTLQNKTWDWDNDTKREVYFKNH